MGEYKPSIKLLVCYHKPDKLLKDDICVPIHVGRAIANQSAEQNDSKLQWMKQNMIGDDTGDNISLKNKSYNELTAIYWAWKNYDTLGNPDFIGLMHYRRHFIFRPSDDVVEEYFDIDDNYLNLINYSPDIIGNILSKYDYIAHIGHVDEVYKHYYENHHIEDLDLAIKILKQKYPKFSKIADEYLQMSDVNFCNMFVFPKKIFFEYCKWIFDILEEFERQIDLSEKRLFISERLTGIFIEYLKRSGLKQKSLSTTFIKSEMRIPVAIPYKKESIFRTAVVMLSILKNLDSHMFVNFYVLHRTDEIIDKTAFSALLNKYDGHSIEFVDVDEVLKNKKIDTKLFDFPEHYPVVLSEILDKATKGIYCDENSLFCGDLVKFFQTCNTDEFYVLGLPSKNENEIKGSIFTLNLQRLREHKFCEQIKGKVTDLKSYEIYNKYCKAQVKPFAWWLYNITEYKKDGSLLYSRYRREIQAENTINNLLYYDKGMEPWKNIQGLYSIYWWRIAQEIPFQIPFDCISKDAVAIMRNQTAYVCELASSKKFKKTRRVNYSSKNVNYYKTLMYRILRYYKRYGLQQTVRRCFQKIKRGSKK